MILLIIHWKLLNSNSEETPKCVPIREKFELKRIRSSFSMKMCLLGWDHNLSTNFKLKRMSSKGDLSYGVSTVVQFGES